MKGQEATLAMTRRGIGQIDPSLVTQDYGRTSLPDQGLLDCRRPDQSALE